MRLPSFFLLFSSSFIFARATSQVNFDVDTFLGGFSGTPGSGGSDDPQTGYGAGLSIVSHGAMPRRHVSHVPQKGIDLLNLLTLY